MSLNFSFILYKYKNRCYTFINQGESMFNPDDFRRIKPELIKIITKKIDDNQNLQEEITMLAQAYGVPLTALLTFVVEDFPEYTEECEQRIERLNEFYGVK